MGSGGIGRILCPSNLRSEGIGLDSLARSVPLSAEGEGSTGLGTGHAVRGAAWSLIAGLRPLSCAASSKLVITQPTDTTMPKTATASVSVEYEDARWQLVEHLDAIKAHQELVNDHRFQWRARAEVAASLRQRCCDYVFAHSLAVDA